MALVRSDGVSIRQVDKEQFVGQICLYLCRGGCDGGGVFVVVVVFKL